MKLTKMRRSWAWGWLRRLPRVSHFRGTWLHRRVGDRLFAPELWVMRRESVACGAAVGAFFAMIPVPFQMLFACFVALIARCHVPTAAIMTLLGNPLTLPLFLYLQYEVGRRLVGFPEFGEEGVCVLGFLKGASLPFLLGVVVSAVFVSGLFWMIFWFGWGMVNRILRVGARKFTSGAAAHFE